MEEIEIDDPSWAKAAVEDAIVNPAASPNICKPRKLETIALAQNNVDFLVTISIDNTPVKPDYESGIIESP